MSLAETRTTLGPASLQSNWIVKPEIHNHEESISKYYSVKNEVDFLNQYKDKISPAEQEFYIRENVLRFLYEFAGHVPYTKISYILKPDGLYFANIKVRDSWQKAAELGGEREVAELSGFSQIENGFLKWFNPNVTSDQIPQSYTWISPSISSYGFAFHLQPSENQDPYLPGYIIDETILRYQENAGQTNVSQEIYYQLTNQSVGPTTTIDFLTHPFRGNDFEQTLSVVGINSGNIIKSAEFESVVQAHLSPLINHYISDVIAFTEHDEQINPQKIKHLEKQIMTIYLLAQQIKQEIDQSDNSTFAYVENTPSYINWTDPNGVMTYGNYLYQTRKAVIVGGGSCPALDTNTGNSLLSNFSITQLFNTGLPIEEKLQENSKDIFECPACHVRINTKKHGPIGDCCPNCNITAERAIKDGLIKIKCE